MATNKLLKNQTKAPVAKTKSKTSPPAPTPAMPEEAKRPSQRKINGLPEERYYAANSALETLSRATQHQQDSKLMGDVRKLAAQKAAELAAVAGTGKKGKR